MEVRPVASLGRCTVRSTVGVLYTVSARVRMRGASCLEPLQVESRGPGPPVRRLMPRRVTPLARRLGHLVG